MPSSSKSRNPWPIAITGYFIVFFSGLVAFIVFAVHQHVDLVRADYYEEEIRFQQQLDRVNRTRQMGESLTVAYDQGQHCITLTLPAAQARPTAGQIHLYRPSDARLDRQIPLALDGHGIQRLDAAQLQSGLWKVRVQWQVENQDYYLDQPVVVSPAGRS